MAELQRRVEPGDFVVVPEYIEDKELRELQFNSDSIRRLRRGEYIAGSLLTQGAGRGRRGGGGRARGMVPGGDRVPTWKLDNLEGSILFMPAHMLVVSDGPPTPKPYQFIDLGIDFDMGYYIEIDMLEEII